MGFYKYTIFSGLLQEVIKDSPKPFSGNRLSFLYCIFLKVCLPAVSV
jgi:hypothetical protein